MESRKTGYLFLWVVIKKKNISFSATLHCTRLEGYQGCQFWTVQNKTDCFKESQMNQFCLVLVGVLVLGTLPALLFNASSI